MVLALALALVMALPWLRYLGTRGAGACLGCLWGWLFGNGAALGLLMGTLGQLGDGGAPASLVISCPLCSALSLASVLQRYVRVAIGRMSSVGGMDGVCSVRVSRGLADC